MFVVGVEVVVVVLVEVVVVVVVITATFIMRIVVEEVSDYVLVYNVILI